MYHTTWKPESCDKNEPTNKIIYSNNDATNQTKLKTKTKVQCPICLRVYSCNSSFLKHKSKYKNNTCFKKYTYPRNCPKCNKLLKSRVQFHGHLRYCKSATKKVNYFNNISCNALPSNEDCFNNSNLNKDSLSSVQCDSNIYKIQFKNSQDLKQFVNQMSNKLISHSTNNLNSSQEKCVSELVPNIYTAQFVNKEAFTEWLKNYVPENSEVSAATWMTITTNNNDAQKQYESEEKFGEATCSDDDPNVYNIKFKNDKDFKEWLHSVELKDNTKYTAKSGMTKNQTSFLRYLSCQLNKKNRKQPAVVDTPEKKKKYMSNKLPNVNCPSKMKIRTDKLSGIVSVRYHAFHNHELRVVKTRKVKEKQYTAN